MKALGTVLAAGLILCAPAAAEETTRDGSLAGRNVVQVALPTQDLVKARRFYSDVLGLPLLSNVSGMLFYQLGNTRLMIGSNVEGEIRPLDGSTIYIDAPDLPQLAVRLEQRGLAFAGPVEVVQRRQGKEMQVRFFRDPDGNLLALMGWVSRK